MNFQMEWTTFALEAEYEEFGLDRIAKAHNSVVELKDREIENLKKRLEMQILIAQTMTDGLIHSVGGFNYVPEV